VEKHFAGWMSGQSKTSMGSSLLIRVKAMSKAYANWKKRSRGEALWLSSADERLDYPGGS
jgi:hypothetical protein